MSHAESLLSIQGLWHSHVRVARRQAAVRGRGRGRHVRDDHLVGASYRPLRVARPSVRRGHPLHIQGTLLSSMVERGFFKAELHAIRILTVICLRGAGSGTRLVRRWLKGAASKTLSALSRGQIRLRKAASSCIQLVRFLLPLRQGALVRRMLKRFTFQTHKRPDICGR